MKKEKNFIVLEIAVCAALVFSVIISSFASIKNPTDEIKENVLRLHIIANSDCEEDQRVKLLVRDAIIKAGGDIFSCCTDTQQAIKTARHKNAYLRETAMEVLKENGFDYEVRTEIGKSYFPTRVYDNITLPAGEYNAVRVILGKGEGHNWWCVMFPPLCLSAAEGEKEMDDILSPEAFELVSSGRKYEVKFKLIEWFENIRAAAKNKI